MTYRGAALAGVALAATVTLTAAAVGLYADRHGK